MFLPTKPTTVCRAAALLLACGAMSGWGQTAAVGPVATARTISLDEAIQLSKGSDTTYAASVAEDAVAQAQKRIAGAALLPSVVYHNQFLYTQPLHLNGKSIGTGATVAAGGSTPRFIANNTVHEYVSQGVATETIGAAAITDLRKSYAEAAAAKARLEVARRGLVLAVVTAYYGVLAAEEKVAAAQRALDDAERFNTVSGQLEAGGEVAHADVIKARLQVQQRQRDLGDAKVAAERQRLDLAVLLFANPLTPYALAGDLRQLPALPLREQLQSATNQANPDLKAALEGFHAATLEVLSSRFDYLPSLSLNYTYGIDADHFATHAPDGTGNLGYSAYATLDIPVWDWFATHERTKQSAARRDLAKVQLTNTQRQLVASIEGLYREAEEARSQVGSLDESVRDSAEALRLSGLRYSAGEAPILEVVDAQNTLIAVQNSRADGAARYFTALANLQTLTGSLP